jgi:hypothetical protein
MREQNDRIIVRIGRAKRFRQIVNASIPPIAERNGELISKTGQPKTVATFGKLLRSIFQNRNSGIFQAFPDSLPIGPPIVIAENSKSPNPHISRRPTG